MLQAIAATWRLAQASASSNSASETPVLTSWLLRQCSISSIILPNLIFPAKNCSTAASFAAFKTTGAEPDCFAASNSFENLSRSFGYPLQIVFHASSVSVCQKITAFHWNAPILSSHSYAVSRWWVIFQNRSTVQIIPVRYTSSLFPLGRSHTLTVTLPI